MADNSRACPRAGGEFPLGLAQPARRALAAAGYDRVEQLAGARAAELKALHGIGPNALNVLRAALHERGLQFADE